MDKETTTVRQWFIRKGEHSMISTKKRVSILMGLALGFSVMITTPSHAVQYIWTDWTTAGATSATGTLGGVNVNFSGTLNPTAQLGALGDINYWTSSPSNPATYTSAEVGNGPVTSDIIRLNGGVATLTFLTPVDNPVLAILSLGRSGVPVDYDFDKPFTILNVGQGYWGNGTLTSETGDVLRGREGHGIIQFLGPVSSISWTIPIAENWHGFTVGTAVPEPASLMLLGAGLAGIGIWRRRAAKG